MQVTAQGCKDRGKKFQSLSYPEQSTCTCLRPGAGLANFRSFASTSLDAQSLETFFQGLLVIRASDKANRPITWLELFVLYILRGHRLHCMSAGRPSDLMPNPDKLLRNFKNSARAYVDRVFHAHEDYCIFKPAPSRYNPLQGLCIQGPMSAPSFNVYVNAAEQIAIARAIVSLSRDLTKANLGDFMSGKRTLIRKVLALNGKASWVSTVIPLSSDSTGRYNWDATTSIIPQVITHFYKCPRAQCDMVEPSTCKEFQYNDLDIRRKCFGCAKATPVRNWLCSCGISWFRCSAHVACITEATSSHSTQVQTKLRARTSLPCKRKAEESAIDYDALFSEDLKNERKWAHTGERPAETVTLGNKVSSPRVPTKLGAVLSKRFGYLMT